jgi:hypothetical protein
MAVSERNPLIWLREGYFVDSDIHACFASAFTDDGKISYYGYDPRFMSFEQAAEKLEEHCKNKGIRIIEKYWKGHM